MIKENRNKSLKDFINFTHESTEVPGGYIIPVTVKLSSEQIEIIDKHSSEEYGKPKRSTFIREILESHFFKK